MTTEKMDNDILENDPIIKRTTELYKQSIEDTEEIVEGILALCFNEEKKYKVSQMFHALGRVIVYITQSLCENREEFEKELAKSKTLINENIFPALGSNAFDEELNKNGVVTFNGTFNEENFNVRRLMMLAGSMIEYIYWRLDYNMAFSEYENKAKNEGNEE